MTVNLASTAAVPVLIKNPLWAVCYRIALIVPWARALRACLIPQNPFLYQPCREAPSFYWKVPVLPEIGLLVDKIDRRRITFITLSYQYSNTWDLHYA